MFQIKTLTSLDLGLCLINLPVESFAAIIELNSLLIKHISEIDVD